MTTETTTAKVSVNPVEMGWASKLLAKALSAMTPAERTEFMADASIKAGNSISKASEQLGADRELTDTAGVVEDQWGGPPDARLRMSGGHGPGSTAKPGDVNIGPQQSASGNGAEKMEGEYSKHAPQVGVQRATEMLGREVMQMRGAMKSIIGAIESQGILIEAIKSSASPIDMTALQAMMDTTVSKAMNGVERAITKALAKASATRVTEIVAKAEEDEKEDEEEEEDEEASEDESGTGTEIEIVNENEAEDEDESESAKSESAKSAAKLRIMARSRLKWVSRRLTKADELTEDSKPKTAEHMHAKARFNLRKSNEYLTKAVALRDGQTGPSSIAIAKSITKAAKKMPKMEVKNQDKWPAAESERMGKGANPADTTAMAALQKAADDIAKAASGVGMLQASVGQMFEAMSGRSKDGSNGLPPVFALAKANADDLTSKEREIMVLADTNVIDFNTLDQARDVIGYARAQAPQELITAKISRLPPTVQAILTRHTA